MEDELPTSDDGGAGAAPERRARRIRHRFRHFRRTRPFWGGVIASLGAIEMILLDLAPVRVFLLQGLGAVATLVIVVLILAMSVLSWVYAHLRPITGIVIVVLALASFPLSNLGGFVIGMLLALVGGSMIFAWTPRKVAPDDAAPDDTVAIDDAAPDDAAATGAGPGAGPGEAGSGEAAGLGEAGSGDAADAGSASADTEQLPITPADRAGDEPTVVAERTGLFRRRGDGTGAPLAVLIALAVAGGLATAGIAAALDSPVAPAAPAATPSAASSSVAASASVPASASAVPSTPVSASPSGSPSASPSASASRSASASASVSASPSASPSPTSGSRLVVAGRPVTLTADTMTVDAMRYRGVATLATATGTVRALRIEATSVTLHGMRQVATVSAGATLSVLNSGTAVLSDDVVMYVVRLTGKLAGVLPIDYTPDAPPPLPALPSLTVTAATSVNALVSCGRITLPEMSEPIG